MIRNGYRPGIIKAGDEVTIKGFRSKDHDAKRNVERADYRGRTECMVCLGRSKTADVRETISNEG